MSWLRAAFFVMGLVLIGSAGYVGVLALRQRPRGDLTLMATHVLLRFAAGVSALWLAISRAQAALWLLAALLLADSLLRTLLQRHWRSSD